ncbi:hypothetical protein BIZ83_gp158 [Erwinia phage vB_EamM_ChrisDB]|uniref:hypothetical protein n=1 Tax=Erwinia phage vB_EamM_ChrisDB TaxID=1883371 RepID=UPI00081CAE0B|nr:hypothetical protein BIZ83_gp158 [Erwinia phage vB_EamM_ChrisDB]ANZ48695.1 hypothetical protein CHRISDB_133 [Erwinia phage vB_EamM_ChrisDB]
MNTDTTLPEQPSAELVIDYVLDVKVEVSDNACGSTHTRKETVYAEGIVFQIPESQLSLGFEPRVIFQRWQRQSVMVGMSPVTGPAPYNNPTALESYRRVNMSQVCGKFHGGSLCTFDSKVVLETNFIPDGPYGERVRRYMKVVPHITLRARCLVDENGRLTGVPGWDIVLPDNWQLVGRERQSTYNTPTHPDFIKSLGLIHEKCKEDGLDFSLHYEEGSDMWSIGIRPMEYEKRFMTGDCVLSNAVEEALDHLNIVGD